MPDLPTMQQTVHNRIEADRRRKMINGVRLAGGTDRSDGCESSSLWWRNFWISSDGHCGSSYSSRQFSTGVYTGRNASSNFELCLQTIKYLQRHTKGKPRGESGHCYSLDWSQVRKVASSSNFDWLNVVWLTINAPKRRLGTWPCVRKTDPDPFYAFPQWVWTTILWDSTQTLEPEKKSVWVGPITHHTK